MQYSVVRQVGNRITWCPVHRGMAWLARTRRPAMKGCRAMAPRGVEIRRASRSPRYAAAFRAGSLLRRATPWRYLATARPDRPLLSSEERPLALSSRLSRAQTAGVPSLAQRYEQNRPVAERNDFRGHASLPERVQTGTPVCAEHHEAWRAALRFAGYFARGVAPHYFD